MSDVIETLARALYDQSPRKPKPRYQNEWDYLPQILREPFLTKATAILAQIAPALDAAAMRELAISIKPDLSGVQTLIDKSLEEVAHLNVIAATIRVNALRHGATNSEVEAFIRGDADFIEWMQQKVTPTHADRLAEALRLPEVAALVKAAKVLIERNAHNNPMRTADMHSSLCQCQRCSLDALAAALRALTGEARHE